MSSHPPIFNIIFLSNLGYDCIQVLWKGTSPLPSILAKQYSMWALGQKVYVTNQKKKKRENKTDARILRT